MGKNITIVGGGSSTFVPHLMRLFIESETLRGSTITLMDVDAGRLEVMDTLAQRLIQRESAALTVRSTTDQRESLAGADFVIVAISVGGMSAWEHDIEIPAKYGIYMHIADSIGPGGIMRAFRHVPILAGICRDLREVSPRARVLNYTNPATANALAMRTVPEIESASLCSCTAIPSNAQLLGLWAGVSPGEVAVPPLVAGVNHCASIVDLRLTDGRDALALLRQRDAAAVSEAARQSPLLAEAARQRGVGEEQLLAEMLRHVGLGRPIVQWVLDTYGVLPYCWSHWAEFYPQLMRLAEPYKGRAQGLSMDYGLRIHDMDHERARVQHWQSVAERWSRSEDSGEVSLQSLPEEEGIEVVAIIEAIAENRNALHIVNTVNHGAIDNLPGEAVVEVTSVVNSYGIRPLHVGPLPEPIAANLRHHISTQQLTVQAALSGDRKDALQAFLLDPVVMAHLNPDEAGKLLDELLQAHAGYLPTFA